MFFDMGFIFTRIDSARIALIEEQLYQSYTASQMNETFAHKANFLFNIDVQKIWNMLRIYAKGAPAMSSLSKAYHREAKLFRHNHSQAVRIPVEFELPGDRVLIYREGNKLIIEPISRPTKLVELLAKWRQEQRLASGDQFPDIDDMPVKPEGMF